VSFSRLLRIGHVVRFLAFCLAGCTSSTAPNPSPKSAESESAAVESARRDERQKLLQEYWYEHAIAAGDPDDRPGASALPQLLYPAGNYGGLNFAPRQAPDSSLAEPLR
jgi:hypothetical protein